MGFKIDEAAKALDAWLDEQYDQGLAPDHFELDDAFFRLYPDATEAQALEVSKLLMDMAQSKLNALN